MTDYLTSFTSIHQLLHPTAPGYPKAPDPKDLPSLVFSLPYDATRAPVATQAPTLVDRTVPSRLSGRAGSPYACQQSQMFIDYSTSNPHYRKKAIPGQLRVLQEAYARTTHPSENEIGGLAKKLHVSQQYVRKWCVLSISMCAPCCEH